MQSSKIINGVQVDKPVECYYTTFKKDKTLSYEFYNEFVFNNITYTIGNFVIINDGDEEIGKIFCIFVNRSKMVELVIRKYVFARNIKELLLKENTHFNDTEVIEDFTKDYIVQAHKVKQKCMMVFGKENDSPDIIKENNLDPTVYFLCRYSLKLDGLFPILSTPSRILTENTRKSPSGKQSAIKKQIQTQGIENRYSNSVLDKATSPINVHKKISTTPIQRNSVKRNLNESFGSYSSDINNSILNYSIVSDEDIENPLLLKFRVSESSKKPFVLIKKISDNSFSNEKEENVFKATGRRKSARKVQRKSYADYVSPIKRLSSDTPSENEDSSEGSSNSKGKKRGQKSGDKSNTPKKNNEEVTLEKRVIRTPKRYQNEECLTPQTRTNPHNSVRRSLRLTLSKDVTPKHVRHDVTPRSKRNNKREKSATSDSDPEHSKNVSERSPQKRINLDESIRRSILKINLNKFDLEENVAKNINFEKESHKSKDIDNDFTSSDSENNGTPNKNRPILTSPSTPKLRARKRNEAGSDTDISLSDFKTPKKNKSTPKTTLKQTPGSVTKATPKSSKNRAKLIRDGVITPSMQSRSNSIAGDKTPLMKARSQLHVSHVPSALPCRGKEYNMILNFVEGKLLDGCGGCIYISGVPGTGKTATVSSVINNLQQDEEVPKFNYVSINGMRLTEPKQAYVEVLKQLTGKTFPWEQAQSMLEERFTKSKKVAPTVMLVDELDILYTKRQEVVYNLLDWPSKAKNQLIVITIANTMDLPERLLINKVASRLGLTRLTFQAYTHNQLQEIVKQRLSGIECFNRDAIELAARKVASVSGDARRALDLCRRAAEIAEFENNSQLVNMSHVNKAVNTMMTQPKVRAIKCCSRLEQLILQSIVAEVERTGVEETTFSDVFKMLISCAAIEGFKMVSSTNAFSAVSRLSACRLILTDPKCNDINQKLILNVSVDDVYYALKRDQA